MNPLPNMTRQQWRNAARVILMAHYQAIAAAHHRPEAALATDFEIGEYSAMKHIEKLLDGISVVPPRDGDEA